MINKTNIHKIPKINDTPVTLAGFVENIRDTKKRQFVILRDRTGEVQLYNEKSDNALTKAISEMTIGSCIVVEGKTSLNPNIRMGGMEVILDKLKVETLAPAVLPLAADTPFDKQLDYRHLSLRSKENQLIFSVQTAFEQGLRDFWKENDFIEIHSPKIMGAASESGAEVFKLDYFGKDAFLAQSPQFYKQMVMASGFDKVFEVGPVFRAENSNSPRHTTEFTSIDVEFSWVDSHHDVMDMEENLLRYAFKHVHAQYGEAIKSTFNVDIKISDQPFPRLPFNEVLQILADNSHDITQENDLDTKGEKILSQHVKEKYGSDFVFVTDYPIEKRAFYHMRHEGEPNLTKGFDLIYTGTEITTGAQREHRHDVLVKQAVDKGMSEESLADYLNFFKHGVPPHGGFGLGLSRMIGLMLQRDSIKDATLIPRTPKRATP